jgi:prepilin-type N-terminal cleavage/methylation domain-containing protein
MRAKRTGMKLKVKNENGFTLVELITAMAIMSILIAGYFSLFFAGEQTYDVVYDGYKIQNEARVAMSYITVKIRQNDRLITIPPIPPAVLPTEYNAVSVADTSGGISYMKVEYGTENEYVYGHNGRLMAFKTTGDFFDSDAGSGDIIAEGLQSITFGYPGIGDTSRILVSISYVNGGMVQLLEETISLRSQP